MKNNHTFSKFKALTESCTLKKKTCRELPASFINDFKIANTEYCRIVALSEVLNIPYERLVNTLVANALGDAHEGFLSAFCNDKERNTYNQQLKQRVQELLSLN